MAILLKQIRRFGNSQSMQTGLKNCSSCIEIMQNKTNNMQIRYEAALKVIQESQTDIDVNHYILNHIAFPANDKTLCLNLCSKLESMTTVKNLFEISAI